MVTGQQQEGQDEVSQAQQELDAQQGNLGQQSAPQYVTAEQMQQLLNQQAQTYERQISGLQSKLDTGLNAIRRDTQSWAEQKIAGLQTEMGRQQWLASLSEEERRLAQPLLEAIQQTRPQPAPNPQPAPQPQPGTDVAQQQWQAVYQMVRNMGIDPQTPGIDYQVLTNTALDQNTREQKFYASVFAAKAKPNGVQAGVQPQQARPQTPNPPINSAAAGRGGGYRTVDEVYDAYNTGRIDTPTFRKEMVPFGGA